MLFDMGSVLAGQRLMNVLDDLRPVHVFAWIVSGCRFI